MSDVSQGPGWWQASDGKWYPPKDADKAPAPGWWLASDGKWYPPVESEQPPQPGWWLAADGKWYPPAADAAASGATSSTAPAGGAKPAVKPVPAKPVAAKPVPAKPVAAKPTPAKAAPATPAAAKPAAAKPAAAKPAPAKPAATKQAPAKPAGTGRPPAKSATPVAAAPSRESDDVRRSGFGMSPEEQIRIRNEASKRDAAALAAKRSMAATRALSTLQGMIDEEKASQSNQDLHESRALRNQPAAPPPTAKAAPPAKAAAKSTPAPKPPAKAAAPAPPAPPASPPPPAAAAALAKADTEPRAASTDSPLLEVKQSPLHSDIDHLGERLVIFTDRVELHDRNDRVRETIYGPDIADVVVHKKFTGSTVTVESGTGVTIVAKGLKPDQAEEIRALILKRTRQGAASAGDAAPAKPAGTGKPGAAAKPAAPKAAAGSRGTGRNRVNQEELLAKLTDLHRAGVLTDVELEEKKALVARLARGESLASTSPPR